MNAPDSNLWHLLKSGAGDAAANMATDEALLHAAQSLHQPVLRFYSWTQPAASFGYFQKFAEIEKLTQLRPLIRRPTGGGLVPHDADWTYSLAIPPNIAWYHLSAIESYRRVHEWIVAAFAKLNVETELAQECKKSMPGQCFVGYEKLDVLWHGQKIAGAAQRRARHGFLIQGSVQPPPIGLSHERWESAMCAAATTLHATVWKNFTLTAELKNQVAELIARTYSQTEYNQRR